MELPAFLSTSQSQFPYYFHPQFYPYCSPENLDPTGDSPPTLGTHTLSEILYYTIRGDLTQQSARDVLDKCAILTPEELAACPPSISERVPEETPHKAVFRIIDKFHLWYKPMSQNEHEALVHTVVSGHHEIAQKARQEMQKSAGRKKGKLMWLVGQVMKQGERGKVDAKEVETALLKKLEAE